MPLTATALASLVFTDHLAAVPTAVGAVRSNPLTGVLSHNVPEAFIGALCDAFVTALTSMVIKDLGAGTSDVPGIAPPVPFSFPGAPVAVSQFLVSSGWVGPSGALVANVFIGSTLLRASQLGLLQMQTNPLLGTGTGVVSVASNPDLEAAMFASLSTLLPLSFQATGKFGEGDIPGSPVNARLAVQLSAYAAALAKGVSSITANVAYVGNASTTAPVIGVVNTGSIL